MSLQREKWDLVKIFGKVVKTYGFWKMALVELWYSCQNGNYVTLLCPFSAVVAGFAVLGCF